MGHSSWCSQRRLLGGRETGAYHWRMKGSTRGPGREAFGPSQSPPYRTQPAHWLGGGEEMEAPASHFCLGPHASEPHQPSLSPGHPHTSQNARSLSPRLPQDTILGPRGQVLLQDCQGGVHFLTRQQQERTRRWRRQLPPGAKPQW